MNKTETTTVAPITRRKKLLNWRPETAVTVLSPIALLLFWWGISLVVGEDYLVSPSTIVVTMIALFQNGYSGVDFTTHIFASVLRTISGYVIAVILAIPIGLWMGTNKYVAAVLNPLFALIRPIPAIAFLPLFIMWFGIGEVARVSLIFLSAFLYIVLNTFSGVKTIPTGLIQAGQNLGASKIQLLRTVIFPAAVPSIMIGLKSGLAISWAIVVAAELMAAQEGLGYMISDASTFFRMPVVYVGIILIGVIGLLLENIIALIEKKSCHWAGK